MKKIKSVLLLFLVVHWSFGQKPIEDKPPFDFYQNDTIQKLLSSVVRTDSVKSDCYLTFTSFDKRDVLVSVLSYYQCQNNSKAAYLTRVVYDRKGKLILREIYNMEGSKLKSENDMYSGEGF